MVLSTPLLLGFAIVAIPVSYLWIRKHRLNDYKQFPQLKPNAVWGHVKLLNEYMRMGRPNENVDVSFRKMVEQLGWPSLCLLDVRPFQRRPILFVSSPEIAEQISKSSSEFRYSVPKSHTLAILEPLIGKRSILTRDGEEWKKLRTRMNPAFARSHLITFLPIIVAKSKQFLNILDNLAKTGEDFALGDLTTALTFDIIGAVVLGIDFRAQEGMQNAHPLYQSFAEVAHTFADESILAVLDPVRKWKKRQAGRRLDSVTKEVILSTASALREKNKTGGRSVLELSLQGIDNLNDDALQEAADSQKTFLFAGHDTTSITLQWTLYELGRYPATLEAMKAELDAVFGANSEPASVCAQIVEHGEGVLRRLTYVRAVVKETLRLYPPASSARLVPKGVEFIVMLPETGEKVNLEDITLYLNHNLIGRNPRIYGTDADCFRPGRWFDNTSAQGSTENHNAGKERIPESAWRPFERGPRNCIGQELANIEAVVILACVARHYDFKKVGLGAFDVARNGKYVIDPDTGAYRTNSMGSLYCRRQITSRPVDDMRMTVSRR